MSIKLAIVDDEELIVQLLTDYFNNQKETEVIITSNDGIDFLCQLKNSTIIPDIALLDLKMKGKDGLETSIMLDKLYPQTKTIIISSFYNKSFIGYMLKNGVNAFLPKNIPPQELLKIIKQVDEVYHFFLDEQINTLRTQLSAKMPKPKFGSKDLLTDREFEVLRLICKQYTAKEIAEELFIAKRTVEGHRTNLLMKTGMKNTAGLVIYAIRENIVDPEEIPLY